MSARDPIDVAEEFIAHALVGEEWQTRDNYDAVAYEGAEHQAWVERGTTARGNFERFTETLLTDLDCNKIETLLDVARTERAEVARLRTALERVTDKRTLADDGESFIVSRREMAYVDEALRVGGASPGAQT
jgi:hypothetical protein